MDDSTLIDTEVEELQDEQLPLESETIEEELDQSCAAELLLEDISELKEEFFELKDLRDITELPNPTRYAALRDLGLTPAEAYLATSPQKKADTRAHLRGGVPHAAKSPVSSMTRREWQIARALFEDMSDSDIEKLYRKVTK